MNNRFTVTDENGKPLTGVDGRELVFADANGFALALSAIRPHYTRGKLDRGAADPSDRSKPYRGPVFLHAETPLEPSGEDCWEVHSDGGYTPVTAEAK